jgi:hypothetical protein
VSVDPVLGLGDHLTVDNVLDADSVMQMVRLPRLPVAITSEALPWCSTPVGAAEEER